MSHFYGLLQGSRGQTTRQGTAKSGLSVVAASWGGCVKVDLSVRDGVDWACIYFDKWKGEGEYLVLYEGPVGDPQPAGSDVDKALRCKTCLHYKNWEPFTNGQQAKGPTAPDKEEKQDGSETVREES